MRHYLLSSTCRVVCQADVIKHILHKPILSGRISKGDYALVEYDLACEPLKSMKGHIVVDFIVEHQINDECDFEVGYITCTPWKLYFDGLVCDDVQGIDVVLISPSGATFDMSNSLDEDCTNYQIEYEALLFGLQNLQYLGVKYVEVNLLVVQQVSKVCQCFNRSLNAHLNKCLEIVSYFNKFVMTYSTGRERAS